MSWRHRRTIAAAVAIIAAAMVALLLGSATSRSGAGAAAVEPVGDPDPATRSFDVRPLLVSDVPPAYAGPEPEAPIIEMVELEKDEVCIGEENLVTVGATTPGGVDDAYLRTVIAGTPGRRAPIRASYDPDRPGWSKPRSIAVFGRGNVATYAEVPPVRLRDCVERHKLLVTASRRLNADSEFELTARIVTAPGQQPPRPVLYRWSFGDGSTEQTMEPVAVHDFADRPQDTLYSTFVVRVEALLDGDAGGRPTIVGRHALEIRNHYFDNKMYAGTIVLRVAMTPRFAERDERGVVEQRFRLWHHEDAPVWIDRVVEQSHPVPDASGVEGPPTERTIEPSALIGGRRLPASGVEVSLAIDQTVESDVLFRTWVLEGVSADGIPVRGVISLMPPPPSPTPDDHVPVEDEALRARIERAQLVLGKPVVSGDELNALERSGAFSDLPEAAPIARSAVPTRSGYSDTDKR